MPDPTKATISASEAAALFGASPYVTPWLLWQRFARGVDIDSPADSRMSWGTKLEPLILEHAAAELRMEVRPNRDPDGTQHYFRRGLLGCHRDGDIICPDRGPGAIEVKSVFAYDVWMNTWNEGKAPPRHIEIQTQVQMYVGDGTRSYEWGVIAAWVCGDVHYFERKPILELWDKLQDHAADFFISVKLNEEPDPFGATIELPWLTKLFPTIHGTVLDLREDPAHVATSESVAMFKHHKAEASGNDRAAELLRAKLLALATEHETVLLPCGVNYRVQKSGKGKSIKPYVPDVPGAPPVVANIMMGG